MSASNWALCPRCVARAEKDRVAYEQIVTAAYGVASPEEYEALRAEMVPVDPEKLRTFREDYEFYGAERGRVVASYRGECSVCGLAVGFEHEEPFYSGEPS